jgi:hypothetical protein
MHLFLTNFIGRIWRTVSQSCPRARIHDDKQCGAMLQNRRPEERLHAREGLRTEDLEIFGGFCSGCMRRHSWPVIAQARTRSTAITLNETNTFRHTLREQDTRFGDKSGSKVNFTRVIIAKIPFIIGERASSPPAVSVVLSCLHFHSEIVELDTPASPHVHSRHGSCSGAELS